jgi:hypothetical protein
MGVRPPGCGWFPSSVLISLLWPATNWEKSQARSRYLTALSRYFSYLRRTEEEEIIDCCASPIGQEETHPIFYPPVSTSRCSAETETVDSDCMLENRPHNTNGA